jgi:hypothetical protein
MNLILIILLAVPTIRKFVTVLTRLNIALMMLLAVPT